MYCIFKDCYQNESQRVTSDQWLGKDYMKTQKTFILDGKACLYMSLLPIYYVQMIRVIHHKNAANPFNDRKKN